MKRRYYIYLLILMPALAINFINCKRENKSSSADRAPANAAKPAAAAATATNAGAVDVTPALKKAAYNNETSAIERKIIKNGELEIQVKSYEEFYQQIEAQVRQYRGYISQVQSRNEENYASAQ